MKQLKIEIKRNINEILDLIQNHIELIYSISGEQVFLKKAAGDFLNKIKIYESKRNI